MLYDKVVKLHIKDGTIKIVDDELFSIVLYNKKSNGYFRITVDMPKKKRSTGKLSQNHAINGYIQQLCVETGAGFNGLKEYCKQKAIERGYPFITLPSGAVIGKSEKDISTQEAAILIDTIKQIAAELNIRLIDTF